MDVPHSLTLSELAERLEACAVCLGYLEDTGRYETRDAVFPDCRGLFAILWKTGSDGQKRIVDMATSHPNPWVRYYLSVLLPREFNVIVVRVLSELQVCRGLVSASALIALNQLTSDEQ
jgi:hypothetical protein